MIKGVSIAIISMALWGLSFVLPLFVPEFSAIEVTAGRYIVYGLISITTLLIYAHKGIKMPSLNFSGKACIFALTGYLGNFVCLVAAIQLLGGPLATVLDGLLPVAVSMFGNWRSRDFPSTLFILPLVVVFSGLAIIHAEALSLHSQRDVLQVALGLGAVFANIALWTWFAVHNAEFLKAHRDLSSLVWGAHIGVFCLIGSIVMLTGYSCISPEPLTLFSNLTSRHQLLAYLMVSISLGLFGSFVATHLWNKASFQLPMALLGQMIVFEVIFGLIYVYIKEATIPSWTETLGISMVLGGVIWSCLRVNRAKKMALQT